MFIKPAKEREAAPLFSQPASNVPRLNSNVLRRLLAMAMRYRVRMGVAVLSALAAAVFNLVMPRLLGRAVDQVHHLSAADATAGIHALWVSAGLVVLAATARGLATGYQAYLGEYIGQRVGYDLRLAFYEKIQRLSAQFHDAMHSGELITRGMLDVEGVRGFLEMGALRAVTVLMLALVGTWRLLHADVFTGLCALSFMPFVVVLGVRMGAKLRVSWALLQDLNSLLTRKMEEALQGMRVVRAFAAHETEMARFDRIGNEALELSARRIGQRLRSVRLMNSVYFGAMGLVLLVGGMRVRAHLTSVGTLTEVLTFMGILQLPLRQVGMVVNSSARASSAGKRLLEILDQPSAIADPAHPVALPPGPWEVRFDDVNFGFPTATSAKRVLNGISFTVKPGQVLGIAGPPGSGKSTIAQLLTRFYDVDEGAISIGGVDIRKLRLEELRQAVGLVQQDTFLFDTSVHENIAYADPLLEEDDVTAAATTAHIHEHVDRLPDRYQTRVGERGVALSGGQRQRMSIARGLAAAPAVMVLDDATAAIDAATEARLRAALDHILADKAVIVIAHRLSALRKADEIIMLDRGRIVERGSHDALIEKNGAYAALWHLQTRTAR